MVVMAVVMADTGMTVLLAKGIASVSGPLFPLVSPFIGLLGSFMSGSNTNSNVMFGLLQMETARALGIGAVTISSIQSIGASVGSSMAPAKVLVAAAVVGLGGQERSIFRGVIPYIIALVLLAGLEAMVVIHLLPALSQVAGSLPAPLMSFDGLSACPARRCGDRAGGKSHRSW